MQDKISIHFLGAAGTVTGSKYIVNACGRQIMIDCGMFQGLKELRLRNWEKLPVDVSQIDDVLITHGHLDHVGYLPLLVKQGFNKTIYATAPTADITKLTLLDSAKIHEEDAERANRYQYSKHQPARPLYTTEEAEAVFPLIAIKPLDQWIALDEHISFRFRYNGHIIGACFIELKIKERILVFSGDIGRMDDPLLYEPERPDWVDVLVMESTYGNRIHPANAKQLLAGEINEAFKRNGTIIIPGFAVERTQLLMFLLWQLKLENVIPNLPVYMDSPMGTHVLDVFKHHLDWHKLSLRDAEKMCQDIRIVKNERETEALMHDKHPKIIIAGSGMATGGRVLSYFEHYLGDRNATILLAGYQGEGTRGRALLDGAKEIKMRGRYWTVLANISMIDGLSAHADQHELLHWIGKLHHSPSKLFITHGEKESAHALCEKIKATYNWNAGVPQHNQIIEI